MRHYKLVLTDGRSTWIRADGYYFAANTLQLYVGSEDNVVAHFVRAEVVQLQEFKQVLHIGVGEGVTV